MRKLILVIDVKYSVVKSTGDGKNKISMLMVKVDDKN